MKMKMKMNTLIDRRRVLARLTLLCAWTVAVAVALPAYAPATQSGLRAEERTTRAEERAQRAQERVEASAGRAQEREARKAAREEEREARRASRGSSHQAPSEGTEAEGQSGAGPSYEPGAKPSDKTTRGCRLSIKASSNRIVAGEAVTVAGALECPAGTVAAGQQITIYQRAQGQGDIGQSGAGAGAAAENAGIAGTATAQTNGSYELTSAALDASTVFKARVGRHVARTVVKVAPLVTLTATPATQAPANAQTSAAGVREHATARTSVTFAGTVSPVHAGASVAIQVAYPPDQQWRRLAFGHVAANGSYTITHAFKIPGRASLRAIVHVAKQPVLGVSEQISYEVPQPQNPQLTIQTSADPLGYGQPVTISGVATGAANQPVTLLARTSRGDFAVVATGTTDASGDYTFTQEPLQSTYYRVTDATTQSTTQSTTLLETVGVVLSVATPPATVQAGQPFTLSGTLVPATAGQAVYLERGDAAGVRFHVIAAGTVDVATQQYQITDTLDRAGTYAMRVTVRGSGGLQGSTSAPFSITAAG